MTDKSASMQHYNHKQNHRVSIESMQRRNNVLCFPPQWIILVVVSLLMIYIDSKNIWACNITNDHPMSLDVPKYISSLTTDAMTSIKKGTPALLRGTSRTSSGSQPSHSSVARQTSARGGNRNNEHTVVELLHQPPVPNILAHNEASIHTLKIVNTDMDDNISVVTPSSITVPSDDMKSSQNDDRSSSKEQDKSQFKAKVEDSVNQMNDRLSEDNVGNTASESVPISSEYNGTATRRKVLCLSGDSYGRTMNQYLQLATILHQLGINGTTVVAFKNPLFTSFYTTWFEPRDDIIVSYEYDAPCDAEYDAVTLHYMFFADKWKQVAYQFKTLMPKASIKEEAERAMREHAGPSNNVPITTVHRRDLEGACVLFAENKNLIACPNIKSSLEMSSTEYKDACLIDYPMIANATHGSSVILLTDGQVPALDGTFPIISKHTFPVQSWMMAISNMHYGNPFSTVDLVVYFWRMALAEANGTHHDDNNPRHNNMQPSASYKPTPPEV